MHTVIVTTAQALSAEQRKEVMRLAAEKAGSKDVTLTEKVDETILGGVIMQIGSPGKNAFMIDPMTVATSNWGMTMKTLNRPM